MASLLSEAQMEMFQKDGYIQVEGLLSPTEVEAFLDHEKEPKPPEVQELGLRKHTADPAWSRLAQHPPIVRIVKQIQDGSPMIVQTMFLSKQPEGGTGIALHQDSRYIHNEPNTLMACWVALNNTDRSNGGLVVVPGSHKRPLLETKPPEDSGEHASWVQEYPMKAPDGREWVEPMHSHEIPDQHQDSFEYLSVPTGSGVFFQGMTIHGSFANRSSSRPRLAFATHYVKEGTWVYRCDIQELIPAE